MNRDSLAFASPSPTRFPSTNSVRKLIQVMLSLMALEIPLQCTKIT